MKEFLKVWALFFGGLSAVVLLVVLMAVVFGPVGLLIAGMLLITGVMALSATQP